MWKFPYDRQQIQKKGVLCIVRQNRMDKAEDKKEVRGKERSTDSLFQFWYGSFYETSNEFFCPNIPLWYSFVAWRESSIHAVIQLSSPPLYWLCCSQVSAFIYCTAGEYEDDEIWAGDDDVLSLLSPTNTFSSHW